jgi:hypothetical protein
LSKLTPPPEADVNVEAIMQQIRQQIIARRAEVDEDAAGLVVTGKRFPPEVYEHMYHARMALEAYEVPVLVSKSAVPLVGPLIEWVRGKLHELVIFYVNQSAARQVAASNHLLKALSLMAQELEETDGPPAA